MWGVELAPTGLEGIVNSKGRFTAELIRLVGFGAAQKLIDHYGNQFLTVPHTLEADHPLAVLLGPEAAERLIWHYGGMRLLIPKGYEIAIVRRNQAIREASAAGLTGPELAQRFDLSHRQIRAILHQPPVCLAALPPDAAAPWGRQLRLF